MKIMSVDVESDLESCLFTDRGMREKALLPSRGVFEEMKERTVPQFL